MPFQELEPGQRLVSQRDQVVVCIPVFGAYDLFADCLLSVLRHTPGDVTLLVCDDASPDQRIKGLVEDAVREGHWPHAVYYLRQDRNVGFVQNVNSAFDAVAPADVVLLNSDCVVATEWLVRLRDAAFSESRIATATALSNAGTIVSVPHRNRPVPRLPDDMTPDRMAERVGRTSLRLRPDLPTCIGHCTYIRRSAVELVGPFDLAFSPGYEEEVDFSQRCLLHGLRHVLADDVFVFHRHMGSFGSGVEANRRREDRHRMIVERYPYFDPWCRSVERDDDSPLARTLYTAVRAVEGMSVSIDGRCLTHSWTGTQLVTLAGIDALDTHADVRLRVLVPDDVGDTAARFLASRPRITLLRPGEVTDGVEKTDVVHRPYQVSSMDDLTVLRQLGRRFVITQLDNIALRNPAYFDDFEEWRRHWQLTKAALAAADQVVFISRHGADDARALELLSEDRVNVVYPESEFAPYGGVAGTAAPSELERLDGRPYLLCLGTDFLHKNRVFAIRLLEALERQAAFEGALVIAGPRVAKGSSSGEEAAYLLPRPDLAARVVDLGPVDESGKQWLLEHAAAVVYPTTYEGFGLVPFEAARAGTPCLFAPQASLAELLPQSAALLVPWDPEESARRAAPVLREGSERSELVRSIRIAGARFTARHHARGLQRVYERAAGLPSRDASLAERVALQRELETTRQELERLSGIVWDPLNRGLVGPDAALPPELRRAVLAIVTRPVLKKTATALYRAALSVRPGRQADAEDRSEA